MTQSQIDRMNQLEKDLVCDFNIEKYEEYCELAAIRDREYRETHEHDLQQFFDRYIKGKAWDEINPEDWSYYSDYHKEVYGFRPKTTLGLNLR